MYLVILSPSSLFLSTFPHSLSHPLLSSYPPSLSHPLLSFYPPSLSHPLLSSYPPSLSHPLLSFYQPSLATQFVAFITSKLQPGNLASIVSSYSGDGRKNLCCRSWPYVICKYIYIFLPYIHILESTRKISQTQTKKDGHLEDLKKYLPWIH